MKLDYTLELPEDRLRLVNQILDENEKPNSKYLEILADYLVLAAEKQEAKKKKEKQKKILTDNRLVTINKRETSYEGLVAKLENGEDGIYNLMSDSGKGAIFQPALKITKADYDEIEPMRKLKEVIDYWEKRLKMTEGKDAFIIKRMLIEMHKDLHVIRNFYRKPIVFNKLTRSRYFTELEDKTCRFDDEGYPIPEGVSLMSPKVCSAILCLYSKLKEDSSDALQGHLYYLMESFDNLANIALKDHPLYERIVEYKIDGLQNHEIQDLIQQEFGIKHSIEYISSLWRNKIPKMIASAAEDEFLDWYYLNVEKGTYKKCSRCGQIKLAHNKYFSKNKTSKDGFYSICKACRNAHGQKS